MKTCISLPPSKPSMIRLTGLGEYKQFFPLFKHKLPREVINPHLFYVCFFQNYRFGTNSIPSAIVQVAKTSFKNVWDRASLLNGSCIRLRLKWAQISQI